MVELVETNISMKSCAEANRDHLPFSGKPRKIQQIAKPTFTPFTISLIIHQNWRPLGHFDAPAELVVMGLTWCNLDFVMSVEMDITACLTPDVAGTLVG
jgi:hypothetical protein